MFICRCNEIDSFSPCLVESLYLVNLFVIVTMVLLGIHVERLRCLYMRFFLPDKFNACCSRLSLVRWLRGFWVVWGNHDGLKLFASKNLLRMKCSLVTRNYAGAVS